MQSEKASSLPLWAPILLFKRSDLQICQTSHSRITRISNSPPMWINSSGGPFWPNLNIQPIQKSNGVPHLSTWHVSRPFNVIWAHSAWMYHDISEISDFGKMSGPHFPKSCNKCVLENSDVSGTQFWMSCNNYRFLKNPIFARVLFSKFLQNKTYGILKSTRCQTAPALADELSNPDPGPSQRTHG